MENRDALRRLVRACVKNAPAADVCSGIPWQNLISPKQVGVDALLEDEALLQMARDFNPQVQDAQGVYQTLFLEHSPVWAQTHHVLVAMKKWGLNPAVRQLPALREQWEALHGYTRVSDGLDAAGLSSLSVRVGLFEDDAPLLSGLDDRLQAMLDITPLFDLRGCWELLAARGAGDWASLCALLEARAQGVQAQSLYIGSDALPDARLLGDCVLPVCRALGLSLVLDNLPEADWPAEGARRIARVPAPQARTFGFAADASALSEAFLRYGWRLTPYCSAQIETLEALPAAWDMARRAIAEALTDVYAPLLKTGWRLSEGEVSHDIERLLSAR